jgi:hypothetical protein
MVATPTEAFVSLKLNSIPWHVSVAGKPVGQGTSIRPMYVEFTSTDEMGQEGIIEDIVGSEEADGFEDGANDGASLASALGG